MNLWKILMNLRAQHVNELRREQMWTFFLGVCLGVGVMSLFNYYEDMVSCWRFSFFIVPNPKNK